MVLRDTLARAEAPVRRSVALPARRGREGVGVEGSGAVVGLDPGGPVEERTRGRWRRGLGVIVGREDGLRRSRSLGTTIARRRSVRGSERELHERSECERVQVSWALVSAGEVERAGDAGRW